MQLRARLVHAETGRRVVRVTARLGTQVLGSALGEAADAEQAEDRARERLLARLATAAANGGEAARAGSGSEAPRRLPGPQPLEEPRAIPPVLPSVREAEAGDDAGPGGDAVIAPDAVIATDTVALEPAADPEDWSAELARIDLQLRRLGWSRDQESVYLQRAFSHASRSHLTTWPDLMAYLRSLESLEEGSDPAQAPIPLRRRDLLAQSDQLLARLGWQAARGREFLERHLGVSSRQQLDDRQLLEFNMLLEGELLAGPVAAMPAEGAHASLGSSVRQEERHR